MSSKKIDALRKLADQLRAGADAWVRPPYGAPKWTGSDAIYHSGNINQAGDIARYGVSPQHGEWVTEILSGQVDDDEWLNDLLENTPEAAWWDDTPGWVRSKIAKLTGKSMGDITDEDIAQYGHLAIKLKDDNLPDDVYRIGPGGMDESVERVSTGERMPAYLTPLYRHEYGRDYYPFGAEVNEIITTESIEPDFNLIGDDLRQFLKRSEGRRNGGYLDASER